MGPVHTNCPACNLRFEVPKAALDEAAGKKPKQSKKSPKKKAASK